MERNMEVHYSILKKAIQNDSLVIFTGAGISRDLKIPDWKGLLAHILDVLVKEDSKYGYFRPLLDNDLLSPILILNLLEEDEKETIFDILVEKLTLDPQQEFPVHKKLLEVSEKIITTNYDKALDYAAEFPNIIHNDGRFKLSRIADHKSFIFKLHGDIDNPESCILFESQYQKLYCDEAFLLGLKILLIQKTILFIGFSLKDPFIEQIINTITKTFDGFNRKHFVITIDKDFEAEKFKKIIKPIVIESYCKLDQILDRLVAFKHEVKFGNNERHNLPDRAGEYHLWRKDQIDNVIQYILKKEPVTVIVGNPGVGKTSLALEIGYLSLGKSNVSVKKDLRFDFIIWVSLKEFCTPVNVLNLVFDEFGRVTGYTKVTHIRDLNRKIEEVNKILSKMKVLIIIDNYELITKNQSDANEIQSWIQSVKQPNEILITTTTEVNFTQNCYRLMGLNQKDFKKLLSEEAKNNGKSLSDFTEENLDLVFETANGNPLAANLILGLIKKDKLVLPKLKSFVGDNLLNQLYCTSYEQLDDNTKELLKIFPLFKGEDNIDREALLQISTLDGSTFYNCLSELISWHLITSDSADRYCQVHSTLVDFLKQVDNKSEAQSYKSDFIAYYLKLIEKKIPRKEPEGEYWNSLVSANMDYIDRDWSAIQQALLWEQENETDHSKIADFAKLLVHYLDSRFLNEERISLLKKAIKVCNKHGDKYLEALFNIDGLGWTYVEECQLDLAIKSIKDGLSILNELDETDNITDLKGLSEVYFARVELEQENPDFYFIKGLLESAKKHKVRAHIQYRIYMITGDFLFKLAKQEPDKKSEHYLESLKSYQLAKNEINKYGGEGGNYQINPRLGLAYLRNGGERNIIQAEKIFQSLQRNQEIHIGKLYGEFGLALVEYKRGHADEAKNLANKVKEELCKRSNPNILLKLIEQSIE